MPHYFIVHDIFDSSHFLIISFITQFFDYKRRKKGKEKNGKNEKTKKT